MTSETKSPIVTIRPATLADLDQIQQISAYYVTNTVINFMYRPPSRENIETIFQATQQRNLPYLVAIANTSSSSPTSRQETREEHTSPLQQPPSQTNPRDQVLGFTYTSPFPSTRLAYAHTLELSIFVHPSHHKSGIGSTLIQALLETLRTQKHHAFEPGFESDTREAYARKLVAKMSYDANGPERGTSEALRLWYVKWGFTQVGVMKDVGYKFGRYIDTMDHILDLDQYYRSVDASVEHRQE